LFIVAADIYGWLVAVLHCLQGGKVTPENPRNSIVPVHR